MPGLDLGLVERHLVLHPDAKIVKQKLRKLHPKLHFKLKMKLTNSIKQGSSELLSILNGLPTLYQCERKMKGFTFALTLEI